MIRIIAGEFKGHKLKSGLDRPGFRPTKDRVKESLFSILGDISGLNVLDIFAGSGNLGFEALSRGAKHVTFVENNFQQAKIIGENVDKVHSSDKITITKTNVMLFLKKSDEQFDLVLADPPYQFKQMLEMIDMLLDNFQNTQIVLETDHRFDIPEKIKELDPVEKIYGNTKLTIFKV